MDDIKKRILALMQKTVENGCTEDEAVSAAEKVQNLLHKYQLSLSDIKLAESECLMKKYDSELKTEQSTEYILVAINNLCDTKVWVEVGKTRKYVFFGLEHDVMVAHYICKICDWAIIRAAEEFKESPIYRRAGPSRRAILKRDFKLAMAFRLSERIDELKKKQVHSTGRDLVVVKNAIIEKEFNALSLNLSKGKSSSRSIDPVAAIAGHVAAEDVSLNPGVTRGDGHKQLGD